MATEETDRTDVENLAETPDTESTFEKIINMPFTKLSHSNLGHECFDKMYYKLAQMLPIYAQGHNDPEIRRLAKGLFEALFLNRKFNET